MKKVCFIIFTLFLYLSPDLNAQILHNPILLGGSEIDKINDIQQGKNGNIYVLCEIGESSPPATIQTLSGKTTLEVVGPVLAIFNTEGDLLKIKNLNFVGQSLFSMAIDEDGNFYFSGKKATHTFIAAKLDPQFNLLWSVTEDTDGEPEESKILTDRSGNVYVAGTVYSMSFFGKKLDFPKGVVCCTDQGYLVKIDPKGNVLWVRTGSGGSFFSRASSIAFDRKGDIVLTGNITGSAIYGNFNVDALLGRSNALVIKYSPAGEVLWAEGYGGMEGYSEAWDVVVDEQNNIFLAGNFLATQTFGSFTLEQSTTGIRDALLLKLDENGKVIWAKSGGYPGLESGYYGIGYAQDKIQVTGYRDATKYVHTNGRSVLDSYSTGGDVILQSSVNEGAGVGKKLLISSENITYVGGEFNGPIKFGNNNFQAEGKEDVFFIQVLDTAINGSLSKIQGHISLVNNDCAKKGNSKGTLVKTTPGNYYGISDENGNYTIYVKPGKYEVTPVIPRHFENYLTPACQFPSPATVLVESSQQTIKEINFSLQILQEAPFLSVDIGKQRLRRCFPSNTIVNYCNNGFSDQENVKLKVVMPTYVEPLESSIPWVERKDSLLIFDIGTLKAGECGTLSIKDSVVCDNEFIRGLTQCFKAFLSTRQPAARAIDIQLTAKCRDNGFIRLRIINKGTEDMKDSIAYRIYLNAKPVFNAKYQLQQNDSLVLNVLADGKTLRFDSDLPTNMGQKSISIEACGGKGELAVRKGFINQFPQDDEALDYEEYCAEILDSYDPNIKQVSPMGISDAHYIAESTLLEYIIHFQNTGTDTAYTVRIEDKLSEYLDISSLQPGLASHPYAFSISGAENPVLKWEFKNIMLPDSTTNEAKSHGFVKFKIRQKSDTKRGTVIRNEAAIFFDYNSPIITNEVFNTVGLPEFLIQEPAKVQNCKEAVKLPPPTFQQIELCDQDSVVLHSAAYNEWFGLWNTSDGLTVENPYAENAKVSNIPYGESLLVWEESFCDQKTEKVYRLIRLPQPEKPQAEVKFKPLVELTAKGTDIRWYTNENFTEVAAVGNVFKPKKFPCPDQKIYVTQTINGCESEAEEVSFNQDFKGGDFFITNVITPNGDGKNDHLFIPPFSFRDCVGEFYSIQIMNRWGKIVYSSTDENFKWQGNDIPAGTYFLVLRYAHFTHRNFLNILH